MDFSSLNLNNIDGIWYTKNIVPISYPEEGNSNAFLFEDNSFWFEHRNNCLIKTLDTYKPPGAIFDIGGGNGFVSLAFEKHGIETVLLEPGQKGAMNAKKRDLKNIICSTLENVEFPEGSMPAAGLFDVLEHIEDDLGFLQKIFKALQPNGRVYITVPAYNFLWTNEDEVGGHFRRYTLSSLSKVFEQAGFIVEYKTYIFSFIPVPFFLTRTIPSRLGFNKDPNNVEKNAREHSHKSGIISTLMKKVMNSELNRIPKKKIGFGGSCMLVAKKPA
jgi:SAM-dependent methyltransferase